MIVGKGSFLDEFSGQRRERDVAAMSKAEAVARLQRYWTEGL
jgi:hypothetical protein